MSEVAWAYGRMSRSLILDRDLIQSCCILPIYQKTPFPNPPQVITSYNRHGEGDLGHSLAKSSM